MLRFGDCGRSLIVEMNLNVKIDDKSKEEKEMFMLFRCTTQEYAERFLKTGNIRFGTPQEWINYYKEHGDGRGDLLEGSFASIHNFDERPINFYKLYRPKTFMTYDERNGNYYFQSTDVLGLRTFCLFGLDRSLFIRKAEGENRNEYPTGSILKQYFEDFSDATQENYEELPKDKKPVLLMIKNPRKFFERLIQSLMQNGFARDEIIIRHVSYMDKKKQFLIGDAIPGELFAKDVSFSYQSEIRVVLMPQKEHLRELIENKNGIFDLGGMNDIADIQDYYFHDFYMQLRGNSLLYVLSKPIETPINDPEIVIGHINQIYCDELPGELLSIEKRDGLIDEALAFLLERFGVTFDKKALKFTNEDGTKSWRLTKVWETLFNHGYIYYSKGEFEKSIDQYSKAIMIDPKRSEAWYNRAVSYFKIEDYEKMFRDMDKAIELDPNNEKYRREREEQRKRHNVSAGERCFSYVP